MSDKTFYPAIPPARVPVSPLLLSYRQILHHANESGAPRQNCGPRFAENRTQGYDFPVIRRPRGFAAVPRAVAGFLPSGQYAAGPGRAGPIRADGLSLSRAVPIRPAPRLFPFRRCSFRPLFSSHQNRFFERTEKECVYAVAGACGKLPDTHRPKDPSRGRRPGG